MEILVLGGSIFLGRAMVSRALDEGAEVTVFNRGRSGPTPGGASQLLGDRTDPADLAPLAGRRFDLVIDTCGYVPADVALSTQLLRETCARYTFVSTVSVYPGWPSEADYHRGGVHHGSPDATREDVPATLDPDAAYGWLKAGCERAVLRAFGSRAALLRPGAIAGPYDSRTGRLAWWIARVAAGGEVLVPGAPDDAMSLVDARDLADFALGAQPGTFDTGGPTGRYTRGDLMRICREVTGSDARFTYVPDEWLATQHVQPWTEIPLWMPGCAGLFAHDTGAAEAAGLRWRPLRETVADTWTWQQSVPGGWHPAERTPGISRERELLHLTRWRDVGQMGGC